MTVYFVEDSHGYGHPACKFKLWQNTTPEYIEIPTQCHTYTQKEEFIKVLSWESENFFGLFVMLCGVMNLIQDYVLMTIMKTTNLGGDLQQS